MRERFVDVPTVDGQMKTFITHPQAGGPFPAVILYMDIWGVREQLFDLARRIATVGYVGVVPNMYYRKGDVTFDYRHPDGTTISLKDLPDEEQAKLQDVRTHLSDDMAIADTGSLLKFLGEDDAVKQGPVGSIGYCMGGRHVPRVAAAFPDVMRAGAALHGTRLVSDAPDSPHLDAPKQRGEIYFGFGELDHYTPPDVIAAVREAYKSSEVTYIENVHAGAHHGYAIPDRDVYDKQAANVDWEIIFAMYDRQLRS